MITRRKDPLDGQQVRVLGRLRRHGGVELLVVLPDGSKRMIPQAWTDSQPAGGGDSVATLGGLGDLLAACVLVSAMSGGEQGQAARQSPCKEDNHAACPAQSAAAAVSGAIPVPVGSPARDRNRRGDQATGRSDRQGGRRPGGRGR